MIVREFKKDFKAELNLSSCSRTRLKAHKEEDLRKTFEEIVSWCINGQTENLKQVIDEPIYYDIIFSACKDCNFYLFIISTCKN